jgi:hypothetical protein
MVDLQKRIAELEQLQAQQLAELKESAMNVVDSINPSSIIKNVFKDIASSPELRTTAIDTAIGIGAGFIGRKLFIGNSGNLFKKIAGTAFQFLITNFVRKKIPKIRENNLHTENLN